MFEARGCPDCSFLGYRGRVAIYELLEVSPRIRRLSARREWEEEKILQIARQEGFRSMRQAALQKLSEGVTSLEEVLTVTAQDDPPAPN